MAENGQSEEPQVRPLTHEDLGIDEAKFQELKDLFEIFDKDGNNYLTEKEIEKVVLSQGYPITAYEMQLFMDTSEDGKVQFEEFAQTFKDYVLKHPAPDDELREAFKTFDRDGNGYISRNELSKVLMQTSDETEYHEKLVTEMLELADINGDGLIDYSEFIKQMMQ